MSKREETTGQMLNRMFWQDDRRRINKLAIAGTGKPTYPPDLIRVLRATNEFFTADAVWRRKDGVWSCTDADPKLRWMRQIPFDSIKNELLKRGCSWEWLSFPQSNPHCEPGSTGRIGTDPIPGPEAGTPCHKLKGTNSREGTTKSSASAAMRNTGSDVASLSLQTGAQPTAAQGAYRRTLVQTAGG